MARIFSPSTQEARTGGSLRVRGWPWLSRGSWGSEVSHALRSCQVWNAAYQLQSSLFILDPGVRSHRSLCRFLPRALPVGGAGEGRRRGGGQSPSGIVKNHLRSPGAGAGAGVRSGGEGGRGRRKRGWGKKNLVSKHLQNWLHSHSVLCLIGSVSFSSQRSSLERPSAEAPYAWGSLLQVPRSF